MATHQTIAPLSDRETEILTLVAQELSNQDIAQACHLTVGTVKVHLHRIYQKLGVENRIQAVRVAHANRLLPLV
jgi:ATP/maltotriose-dependent transcriptional regulator MalT